MQSLEKEGIKSIPELADSLGYTSPEKIYRLSRKPNARPSFEILEDITKRFENINIKYILTGRLLDKKSNDFELREPEAAYKKMVPVYGSPATASQVEVYNDLQSDGPAFYVNIPQFSDCKFGKAVYGHSMYPTITSGSYVFCKEVINKASFMPGEIYYIEYDNFGVCKRLQKGHEKGEVMLVSDNIELRPDGTKRYESYSLKLDEIRKLYLVKGFFNQNHN